MGVSEKLKAQTERLNRLAADNKKYEQVIKNRIPSVNQTAKEFKVLQRDVIQQDSLSAQKAYNAIRELQLRLNKHRVKANQERIQVLPEVAAPKGPDQTTYLETIKKGISSVWSAITGVASAAITKVKGVACGGSTPMPEVSAK